MNKKELIPILPAIFVFVLLKMNPAFAASSAVEYMCSLGITSYELGRYDDALSEFNKVLLVDPVNQTAKKYINVIFEKQSPEMAPVKSDIAYRPVQKKVVLDPQKRVAKQRAINKAFVELEKQMDLSEEPKEEFIQEEVVQEEMLPEEESEEEGIAEEKEEKKLEVAGVRISGEVQARLGMTPDDVYWKRANWDLNEKNFRVLSDHALDRRENSYDPRIYDRLRVNLDAGQDEGFGFHSNITIDPWSFTGKSDKITVNSAFGDTAKIQFKYWSSTGYTINEPINSTTFGNSFQLPEQKVKNNKISALIARGAFLPNDTFFIPETKIHRTFQPLREFWLDYKTDNLKLRVYPIAYENQALTFDDPLRLSNNHIWWEDSPWIHSWKPGLFNSGTGDFTKGFWDNTLSFFTKDSEGRRLTALRGFSFDFSPLEGTSITTSVASPKTLWQDYSEADNFLSATRLNQSVSDNLKIGLSATTRHGYNIDDKDQLDAQNYVLGSDVRYEIMEGVMASMEVAGSRSRYDLSNSVFKSTAGGSAYYFSLMGRFPSTSIIDTMYGYNGIQPAEDEQSFTKFRFFVNRMDDSFDPSLSNYIETRDDEFWSRHLHFREPFKYYYQGEDQLLSWDDIKNYAVGNGIDVGRSTVGLRIESLLFDRRVDNLFDVRNVHATDGKFIENVAREQMTWKVNEQLTAKILGIYQRLPRTKAGIDPFVFNPLTRRYFDNAYIEDGKDPSISTGSLGLNYDFFDWLGLNGIWECTNDISLGYDNFPRGLLNSGNRSVMLTQYGDVYRELRNWLYGQEHFPRPPYPYYNILKSGLRITPMENLEVYLDYTRNSYEKAGPIDDNMNHVGLLVSYSPIPKLAMLFKYTYSRWQDIDKLAMGIDKVFGHHNVFTELIYKISDDQDFTFQYGEGSRDPYMGGVLDIGWDPYGGDLRTVDTQHIFRMYYRRKF